MYRVMNMSGNLMAVEFDEIEDDIQNIEDFIQSGDVVLLCEDLESLHVYKIDPADVEIV